MNFTLKFKVNINMTLKQKNICLDGTWSTKWDSKPTAFMWKDKIIALKTKSRDAKRSIIDWQTYLQELHKGTNQAYERDENEVAY